MAQRALLVWVFAYTTWGSACSSAAFRRSLLLRLGLLTEQPSYLAYSDHYLYRAGALELKNAACKIACNDCKTGFAWTGQPTGLENRIANNNTYVTGSSQEAAILIIADYYGWKFTNLRLLADHFAHDAQATVYLPDFFGGEVIDPDTLSDPTKRQQFDLPAFLRRNSKEIRFPEIKSVAQALKSQYPKVVGIGYCYGGWAQFKLGADPSLIDAVSVAHPSGLTKEEIEDVKVPMQILSPEKDALFTQELKDFANRTIPTLNVPYEYVYFPGASHGFASKGDPSDHLQKHSLERAKRSAVHFFNEFLH